MQNYNGNDERSRAVDHVQRSVSSEDDDARSGLILVVANKLSQQCLWSVLVH